MNFTDRVKKYLPVLLALALISVCLPRGARFPYEYSKGREWKYETLFAQFDFPIYKTSEQISAEKAAYTRKVIPYYNYSQEVVNSSLDRARSLDLGPYSSLLQSSLKSIYSKGVLPDDLSADGSAAQNSEVIYIQRDKRAEKVPIQEVYRLSDARARLLSGLETVTDHSADSLFRSLQVQNLLVPNVLYDKQTTELVISESDMEISPTSGYVSAGQLIVSEGELVTAQIAQMLDSYKKEYARNLGSSASPALTLLGNILLGLALTLFLFFVLKVCEPKLSRDSRYYYYIFTLFGLSVLASLVVPRFSPLILFFVPYTLFALMLQAFIERKEAALLYLVIITPLLFSQSNGAILFVMFAISGVVSIYIFPHFRQGWKQFLSALITFAVLTVVYLAFRAAEFVTGSIWYPILGLFLSSMLSVAGYPLVFLCERLFNLVSDNRLSELCDMSNPLIRSLEQKAPGTFQHSLQVMNMADFVARSVDVNPDLVRAGALYHDIGKINNPLCFIENECLISGSDDREHSYHKDLPAAQSAADIVRHVTDGEQIARKHHLPPVVIGFIRSHHGTTVVKFFYNKFLKQEGGDASKIDEFRYKGERPVTKAQVIVMLCDSIEAASRTLKTHTREAYSNFVEGIVEGKMQEGQFDDAQITISELNAVKEALKQYLAQLNHERVVYPKNK